MFVCLGSVMAPAILGFKLNFTQTNFNVGTIDPLIYVYSKQDLEDFTEVKKE